TRMGRWDAIFFVDNPNPKERLHILGIYCEAFKEKTSPKNIPAPEDLEGYSGAEIRQVAIEAAYNGQDLEAATRFVIPISKSQKAQMDALREWARARTIPASRPVLEKVGKRRVSL
ncbi:MAG: hypothetical protein WC600_18790, partial [Desulfobaccales bacterium]